MASRQNLTLKGFMLWRGAIGPCGSHHSAAIAENLLTSLASTATFPDGCLHMQFTENSRPACEQEAMPNGLHVSRPLGSLRFLRRVWQRSGHAPGTACCLTVPYSPQVCQASMNSFQLLSSSHIWSLLGNKHTKAGSGAAGARSAIFEAAELRKCHVNVSVLYVSDLGAQLLGTTPDQVVTNWGGPCTPLPASNLL